MPINFVDGLGYTVNGDTLNSVDFKVAWERVEKVWRRGGNKVPKLFHVVFTEKNALSRSPKGLFCYEAQLAALCCILLQ